MRVGNGVEQSGVGSGKLTLRKAGLIGVSGSELAVDFEGEKIGREVFEFKGISLGVSGGARSQHHSHDQTGGHSILKDIFVDKLVAVGGHVESAHVGAGERVHGGSLLQQGAVLEIQTFVRFSEHHQQRRVFQFQLIFFDPSVSETKFVGRRRQFDVDGNAAQEGSGLIAHVGKELGHELSGGSGGRFLFASQPSGVFCD